MHSTSLHTSHTISHFAGDEDAAPALEGDWREFRRGLLQKEQPAEQKGRESEMNMELLRCV